MNSFYGTGLPANTSTHRGSGQAASVGCCRSDISDVLGGGDAGAGCRRELQG